MNRPLDTRKTFTVVGFYEQTGQTFAYQIRAGCAFQAMQLAVNGDYVDMSNSSDVAIVGAFVGNGEFTAPCDDSGAIAYVCDLEVV